MRGTRRTARFAAVAAVFAGQPQSHWIDKFAGVDCCVTPVATLDEALADPHDCKIVVLP